MKLKKVGRKSSKKVSPKKFSTAFGRNYFYPITGGDAATAEENTTSEGAPTVPALPWKDGLPVSAACSSQATIAATEKGRVYMTGTMHGHVYRSWTRIEVPLPGKVTAVAAGRHFAIALTEKNAVVTWGAGHFGQLGVMVSTGDSSGGTSSITFSTRPILVERLLHADSTITRIAAGDWHGLAVAESGQIWAWGSNRSLQCGLPNAQTGTSSRMATTIPLPLPISPLPPMKDVSAGRSHTLALTKTGGRVYSWGHSTHGQCGTGVATRSKASNGSSVGLLPSLVEALPASLEIQQIAAGGHHSMALTKAGRVFSWGLGAEGELGLHTACRQPHTGSTSKPRLVCDLDFVAVAVAHIPPKEAAEHLKTLPKIAHIQAGASYGTAVCTAGKLYCWGSNDVGQLGFPTSDNVVVRKRSPHGQDERSAAPQPPQIHVKTFDSNHNVLLPTRVEAVDHIRVLSTVCGPNHMWCFGEEPIPTDEPVVIGRTLHEAQGECATLGNEEEDMIDPDITETSSPSAKLGVDPLVVTVSTSQNEEVSPPSVTDPETPSVPSQSAAGVFQFGAEAAAPTRVESSSSSRKGMMRRLSHRLLRRHHSQASDTSLSANGGSQHSRNGESKFFGRFQAKSP